MICRDSLLWRNVAEHSFLLVVVAAHSLVSLTFLTSDEFFELKLQREWVFQQTAKAAKGTTKKARRRMQRRAGEPSPIDFRGRRHGAFAAGGAEAVTHAVVVYGKKLELYVTGVLWV